mmetsp:Transcript_26494/g.79825  ORF Transcript_26494/g.79825 Transcript_26494/m.79825 type:complete len:209 (-) Transcript_26494:356-982(-)
MERDARVVELHGKVDVLPQGAQIEKHLPLAWLHREMRAQSHPHPPERNLQVQLVAQTPEIHPPWVEGLQTLHADRLQGHARLDGVGAANKGLVQGQVDRRQALCDLVRGIGALVDEGFQQQHGRIHGPIYQGLFARFFWRRRRGSPAQQPPDIPGQIGEGARGLLFHQWLQVVACKVRGVLVDGLDDFLAQRLQPRLKPRGAAKVEVA